jgi:hypothetical protein
MQEALYLFLAVDEFDSHRKVLSFDSAGSNRVDMAMGSKSRVGPDHRRPAYSLLVKKTENLVMEKISVGTDILIEVNRDLDRRANLKHWLSLSAI